MYDNYTLVGNLAEEDGIALMNQGPDQNRAPVLQVMLSTEWQGG